MFKKLAIGSLSVAFMPLGFIVSLIIAAGLLVFSPLLILGVTGVVSIGLAILGADLLFTTDPQPHSGNWMRNLFSLKNFFIAITAITLSPLTLLPITLVGLPIIAALAVVLIPVVTVLSAYAISIKIVEEISLWFKGAEHYKKYDDNEAQEPSDPFAPIGEPEDDEEQDHYNFNLGHIHRRPGPAPAPLVKENAGRSFGL